jgi:hypothetical protein
LYGLNRFAIKPATDLLFFEAYFNDLVAMPFLLGYANLLSRGVLPAARGFESPWRVAALTVGCVVVWEVLAPAAVPWSVGDPWDVAAYSAGSIAYLALVKVSGCGLLGLTFPEGGRHTVRR